MADVEESSENIVVSHPAIGFIGFGVVGQATYSLFKDSRNYHHGLDIFISDPAYPYDSIDYTDNLLAVFISIPVNDKDFRNIFEKLSDNYYNGLVVIRSSILPDMFDQYVHDYPRLKLVAQPEFLREISSFADVQQAETILLGGEIRNLERLKVIYDRFAKFEFKFRFVKGRQAFEFKYIHNLYGIAKILFWEMAHDVTGNSRLMYDLYKELGQKSNSDMAQVGMDGYRGIGGKCFPENLRLAEKEFHHPLLSAFLHYDDILKGKIDK